MAALLPWLPPIVAFLTATAAILAYAQQRRVDRRTTLMEMRRGYYRQFIEAPSDTSDRPDISRAKQTGRITRYIQRGDVVLAGGNAGAIPTRLHAEKVPWPTPIHSSAKSPKRFAESGSTALLDAMAG